LAPAGSEWDESMVYYDKLRYQLMPYIYSLAGKTYLDNYTMMRGLVMDFNQDPAVRNIADQYMFGPSILLNPGYTYKSRQRKVYLPAGGGWYEFGTSTYREGGQAISAAAPLGRMPMFVREGAIIPQGPVVQYAAEPVKEISLHVYTGKDGAFSLYEDENVNNN